MRLERVVIATLIAAVGGGAGVLFCRHDQNDAPNGSSVDVERIAELDRRVRRLEVENERLTEEVGRSDLAARATRVPIDRAAAAATGSTAIVVNGKESNATDSKESPPRTLEAALLRVRRARSADEVHTFYRVYIEPRVSALDPPFSAQQIEQFERYLATEAGDRWAETRDALEKFEIKLDGKTGSELVQADARNGNEVMGYLKRVILKPEQLRWYPYGKAYQQQVNTPEGTRK